MIPYVKHELPDRELIKAAIDDIWETGQISNFGTYNNLLEENAKKYIGNDAVLSVSNCDTALKLAVKAMDMDNEFIALPDFTFISTYMAAEWNNCKIHLMDVNKETLLVDLNHVEDCAKFGIKSFILVNTFGNMYDIHDLKTLRDKYSLKILIDAAHSFGSTYKGKKSGNLGFTECFSFSPTKTITSGEGGLVSTSFFVRDRLELMRKHGFRSDYDTVYKSVNGKMPEVSCAILAYSIDMVDDLISKKRNIVKKYRENINYKTQKITKGVESVYKDFIFFPGKNRKEITKKLDKNNIAYKRYFFPLHLQRYVRSKMSYPYKAFEGSSYIYENSLCIPSYTGMTDEQVEQIIELIK